MVKNKNNYMDARTSPDGIIENESFDINLNEGNTPRAKEIQGEAMLYAEQNKVQDGIAQHPALIEGLAKAKYVIQIVDSLLEAGTANQFELATKLVTDTDKRKKAFAIKDYNEAFVYVQRELGV